VRKFICLIGLSAALAGTSARADGSLFDSLAKATGLVAPTPDPPDFVKASRPKTDNAEIPVFAAPQEPPSKVKSASELKTMDADLTHAARSQGAKPADRKTR
jgi:hypothetical protein